MEKSMNIKCQSSQKAKSEETLNRLRVENAILRERMEMLTVEFRTKEEECNMLIAEGFILKYDLNQLYDKLFNINQENQAESDQADAESNQPEAESSRPEN
eukprot:TRINITY_DN24675_c0_g1_i1.p2 TRINITY_DN24675_c0_g1~~TRINITY_DN24675_c0_g1_i1.p2  ORF type:complete len:101 (+),score=18.31 TRINITY_DN24675_c0_g1_i1:125-427(+)